MTDKEVFKKLAKIKNFNLLEDKEKFLICDYLHYSIQIALENDELSDTEYDWGGEEALEYDSDYSEPWGFETTGEEYGEIFDNINISLLQEKEDYGILVKVEISIEEDSFCFTFWDCEIREIDFSKLPDFSCSVNSPEEALSEDLVCALLYQKGVLEGKLKSIRIEAKQLREQLKEITAELDKLSVSSFEE